MTPTIDIVFEDLGDDRGFRSIHRDGKEISLGSWHRTADDRWTLRIPDHDAIRNDVIRLAKESIAEQEANLECAESKHNNDPGLGAVIISVQINRYAFQTLRTQLARVLAPLGFDPLK